MKKRLYRLGVLLLALVLAATPVAPAAAALEEEAVQPMAVTVPDYTRSHENIRAGGLYTLIALPRGSVSGDLTAPELLGQFANALYIGSATAEVDGEVTFTGIRLKTAQAVDFYVTGPGLATPLKESTSSSVGLEGSVTTGTTDRSATLALVDAVTGYRYANTTDAGASNGYYWFSNLAPTHYSVQITKPGYLPYVTPQNQWVEIRDGQSSFRNFDISAYLGDVNGDGKRNMSDLAALLRCYGAETPPAGLYADLDGSGTVDAADVRLLTATAEVTGGTGSPAQPTLSVADLAVGQSGLRKLVFTLSDSSGATLPAAAFTLRYRSDYIQPCNSAGGVISPANGGTVANCLIPGSGFSADRTLWAVEGDAASLTFSLTAAGSPPSIRGSRVIAEFYYRPAVGKTTDSFFAGVFTLPHTAVLLGEDTVVTQADLTYPNWNSVRVTAISINAPSDAPVVTIPAAGGTAALTLSATGTVEEGDPIDDLPGVTWAIVGGDRPGITLSGGLFSVTSLAQPGTLSITASRDGVTSPALTVTLERAPSQATTVEVLKDGGLCLQDALELDQSVEANIQYIAQVYDQYGIQMSAPATWTLVSAPEGVTLADGLLSIPATLPAGAYSFRLQVTAGKTHTVVDVALTVVPILESLIISGPQSVTIPTGEEAALTLRYDVSALDKQGKPMTLEVAPTLSLQPQNEAVRLDSDNRLLTVTAQAQPGEHILTASAGEVTAQYPITLLENEDAKGVRIALYAQGAQTEQTEAVLAQNAGEAVSAAFEAKLLDHLDQPVESQGDFTWRLEGAPEGVAVSDGLLTAPETLSAGRYSFALVVTHTPSGISTRMGVTLALTPTVTSLTLTGPGDLLSIPTDGQQTYTFSAAAFDANGAAMALPAEVTWSVTTAGGSAPEGVRLQNGVLTVYSTAAPGQLTITAAVGEVSQSLTLTLETQGGVILQLYRDGVPVSGKDLVNIREGTALTLQYQAFLIDQATGTATPAENAVWFQGIQSLSVDKNAERGVYTAQITAVAGQQSASITATIAVYPNLIHTVDPEDPDQLVGGVTLRFDGPIEIPAVGSTKVYVGELMAHTVRGEDIPFRDLGIDYAVKLDPLPAGVRASYDMDTHSLSLILDASAIAYKYLTPSQNYRKNLLVELSYFPGEAAVTYAAPLTLTYQPSRATSALLRAGTLEESGIVFRNLTQGTDTLTAAPDSFANCYAIELRDQYGKVITNAQVNWALEGAPNGVTLLEDPDNTPNFANYASFRRLSVAANVPEGTYEFALTASVGSFSHRANIVLTVTAAQDMIATLSGGAGELTIPRCYTTYNSSKTNSEVVTTTFTATFTNADGYPPAPAGKQVVWSLDKSYSGVTLKNGTLSVDRNAKPGKVTVRAALMSGSTRLALAEATVDLKRAESVPTLLTIHRDGKGAALTRDTVYSSFDGPVTVQYVAQVVDQYDQPVDNKILKKVTWRNTTASGIVFRDGLLALAVSTPPTSLTTTATLAANAGSNVVALTANLTVYVQQDTGGGGGGGGGGETTDPDTPPVATPAQIVTPPLTLSGTAGTATLTPEEESSLLAASGQGTLVISPTGATGTTGSVSVTMSGATASAIANQKVRTVELRSNVGNLVLSPDALRTAASMGSAAVTISVQKTAEGFRVAVQNGSTTVPTLPGTNTLTAPVSQPGTGTVAILVKTDGTEVLLRKSVVSDQRLITPIPASGTVKLVDRAASFDDTQNHWAAGNISFVTARDLFQGTSRTTFTPNGTMTRAMLVTVLHRLEDTPAATRAVTFADVPAQGSWYTDSVAWASQKGIVQGSGNKFNPDTPVTREQLATILYRYAQFLGLSTSGRSSLTRFSDGGQASSWATDALSWTVSAGLLSGKGGGRLDPQGQATRAEVATILERLIRRMAASR